MSKEQDPLQVPTDLQTPLEETQITFNCEDKDFQDGPNNFCKISNVFSLNGDLEDTVKNNIGNVINDQNPLENSMEIKDEPLDLDVIEEYKYNATDEETLDASETASYNNRCSPSLQEFIYSVPEINPDQYVDIPDFVTINNFGFKELEELRLQQQINEQTKPDDKIPEIVSNLIIPDTSEKPVEEPKPEVKVMKVLSNAPDVIILNGKRMVKCGNKYRVAEEQPQEKGEETPAPTADGKITFSTR